MIIKKTTELYFKKNDIYILDSYCNNIIVNDDYHGLMKLTSDLDIEKRISIEKETTIYFIYKEFGGDSLLIYSADQERMTIVNTINSKNSHIILSHLLKECVFSPIYYWKNDILILTTYNHIAYKVCFLTHSLQEISKNEVKKIDHTFFDFCNESKNYNILKVYAQEYSFIFQKDDEAVGFCNFKNNKKTFIRYPNNGWHDVECSGSIFIFVYETKLMIIHNNTQVLLQPNTGYIFLRVKFLIDNTIAVLSSNPSNVQDSVLEVYILKEKV